MSFNSGNRHRVYGTISACCGVYQTQRFQYNTAGELLQARFQKISHFFVQSVFQPAFRHHALRIAKGLQVPCHGSLNNFILSYFFRCFIPEIQERDCFNRILPLLTRPNYRNTPLKNVRFVKPTGLPEVTEKLLKFLIGKPIPSSKAEVGIVAVFIIELNSAFFLSIHFHLLFLPDEARN
nr:MAG TPA: hypothetical protein [Caudoviricetes sp.]